MIVDQLARELGVEFGFAMSSSAVFLEIAQRVPAYSGLRYPLLKDESQPVQVKHSIATQRDISNELETVCRVVEQLDESLTKITGTPDVGHELFKIRTLTDKAPQFHLLAAGNPRPESVNVSPLYQITISEDLQPEVAAAGD